MNSIRISIIIPFYNVQEYIEHCLDSVYSQDIPEEEYEVICVDDCSPDDSISIVERFAREHSNLRIVRNQENRKLGGARNAGMEVARGKYVMFVDSDDFIHDNVLASLFAIAEQNNLDVLHFDYENYPHASPYRKVEDTPVMSGPELFFLDKFVWHEDLVTVWRKLFSRKFLLDNKIKFAEHIMFEDNDYSIWTFAKAKRVMHIAKDVYYYRNNPDSITRSSISPSHISYWLSLCHRLVEMKRFFCAEGIDVRFQTVIDQFVRYLIYHAFGSYHSVPKQDRKEVKKAIRGGIDKDLYGFMSKRRRLCFLLGVIV